LKAPRSRIHDHHELRDSSDPLRQAHTESFIVSLNIVRQKTKADAGFFFAAREKYFQILIWCIAQAKGPEGTRAFFNSAA